MNDKWARDVVGKSDSDKARIAMQVGKDPQRIPQLIAGLEADKASVKYGCAKVLLLISEKQPELLYAHWHVFRELLSSDKNVLRWNAIQIFANLASVDSKNQINRLLITYLAPLQGPCLITAANTIAGAATIAAAKPELENKILPKLLGVEQAKYATAECRQIAIAKTMDAVDRLWQQSPPSAATRKKVVAFAERHRESTRAGTRRAAQRLLKKYGGRKNQGPMTKAKGQRKAQRRGKAQ